MATNYFTQYNNLDTHWFECRVCGQESFDSDTAALAGFTFLAPSSVPHTRYCPGKAFPDKHVRRITRV